MEINRKFQDQHTGGDGVDWVQIQLVERDICLLYHQLADYSYVMADLYYGSVFALPYWEYLDVAGVPDSQRDFLRDGCLVMIFAMALEVIDGSGAYLTMDRARLSSVKEAVAKLQGLDEQRELLVGHVRRAVEGASNPTPELELEASTASVWIHEKFVRPYFETRAQAFRENPYYRGAPPEDC